MNVITINLLHECLVESRFFSWEFYNVKSVASLIQWVVFCQPI